MRRVIITCDKCAREVDGDNVTMYNFAGNPLNICNGCRKVFESYISARLKEWCEGTPLAEPVKVESATQAIEEWESKMKKKTTVKKSSSVDWDKACALRRAGWSYAKIAEELYISASSVYKKLYLDGYYSEYLEGKRMEDNDND